MPSPTYFPRAYFGAEPSSAVSTAASTVVVGGGTPFESLYSDRLDYELGTNDSAVLFTTARRKACINEGLREFADLTECWVKTATIPCTSAGAVYALDSTAHVPGLDFVRLTAEGPTFSRTDSASSVTSYVAGKDFPRRDPQWLNSEEPGWQQSSGALTPSAWMLTTTEDGAQAIQLYPRPTLTTGSSGNGVLSVPYVARPSSLVSTSAVPFTDSNGVVRQDLRPYHQAIVHYAAHKLELLRRDTEASDRQMQKFLGYVQRFIQQKRKPEGGQIRPARSYFRRAGQRHGSDDLTGLRATWWR